MINSNYKKFYTEKIISLISITLGGFLIFNTSIDGIYFIPILLIITSVFVFFITELRPTKNLITILSLLIMFVLTYRFNSSLVLITISAIIFIILIKAENKKIESVLILTIFPILFLTIKTKEESFLLFLRYIGLTTSIILPFLINFTKDKEKAFMLYYLSHLFILLNSSYTVVILLMFLFVPLYFKNVHYLFFLPGPFLIAKLIIIKELFINMHYLTLTFFIISSLILIISAIKHIYMQKFSTQKLSYILFLYIILIVSSVYFVNIINSLKNLTY
jgi:hypothetical protein